MTREEAIAELKAQEEHLRGMSIMGREAYYMAIEALKQPEVKCLECDHLKSCMYAWDVDCGCEFFKVNGAQTAGVD